MVTVQSHSEKNIGLPDTFIFNKTKIINDEGEDRKNKATKKRKKRKKKRIPVLLRASRMAA